MRKLKNKLRLYLLCISLLTVTGSLNSFGEQAGWQQNSVSGKVTFATGRLLIPEGAERGFSFIGMQIRRVDVGNQTDINVTMELEMIGLEEVVAVSYCFIRRSIPAVTTALKGKLPGFVATQRSGEPGNILMHPSFLYLPNFKNFISQIKG